MQPNSQLAMDGRGKPCNEKHRAMRQAASMMGITTEEYMLNTASGNIRCSICKEWKPREAYWKSRRTQNANWCRRCMHERYMKEKYGDK